MTVPSISVLSDFLYIFDMPVSKLIVFPVNEAVGFNWIVANVTYALLVYPVVLIYKPERSIVVVPFVVDI